jgi:hypothetical protein
MDSMAQVPLPWERLLWSARTVSLGGRYALTDFRLVFDASNQARSDEIAVHDIGEIVRSRSWFNRLTRTSTLVIRRRGRGSPFVLRGVRRGAQLAALLELLSGDPQPTLDETFVRSALRWEPRTSSTRPHYALAGLATALALVFGLAFSLGGSAAGISYPSDDAIYPSGSKRDPGEIVRFMENEVLPWARTALAPIVGGADRVGCSTCHGADDRNWQMPSVAALPEPVFRRLTFERYSPTMDSQTRNAIYGYLAEADKQGKAAYMREIVMPGMARLLHRPPYDFTKSFDYNRTRFAFGCYHCHKVS